MYPCLFSGKRCVSFTILINLILHLLWIHAPKLDTFDSIKGSLPHEKQGETDPINYINYPMFFLRRDNSIDNSIGTPSAGDRGP